MPLKDVQWTLMTLHVIDREQIATKTTVKSKYEGEGYPIFVFLGQHTNDNFCFSRQHTAAITSVSRLIPQVLTGRQAHDDNWECYSECDESSFQKLRR